MKNKIKGLAIASVPALAFAMPFMAHASIEYTSQLSTTTALVQQIGSDVLSTVGVTIGIVLGIAVFVVGVGYAWRKLKSKAIGKAF